MEEKIKDLFLILLVGAVIVAGYYFYQNNFGIGDSALNDVDIEMIEGGDVDALSNQGYSESATSDQGNTYSNSSTQSDPVITEDGIYLIYLYKSGFSPNYLKIRRGTSVRFINKTDSSMRIYAADQSTGVQRQLNQSKTVGYNGTYEYSFSSTGIWIYTNATDKTKMGTVEVF